MWVAEYRASRFSSVCVHIGTYLSKSICCVFCSMQTFMVHSFVFFYHRNKKWKRARCLFSKPPNETWKNRRHRKRPKAGKFREKSFARCTEVRQTKRMAHNHVKLKLEKYKLHCLWPCSRKSARSRCEFTFSECDTYNKVESGSFIDNCKLFGCWLLLHKPASIWIYYLGGWLTLAFCTKNNAICVEAAIHLKWVCMPLGTETQEELWF